MAVANREATTYPVRLSVDRAERQSRLTNLPLAIGTFIRYILLIPHLLVILALGIVAGVLYFVATFAILFTGKYPQGMYNFVAGYLRWSANAGGYLYHLYDPYPPFSMEAAAGYPLQLAFDYPERSSRILNLPFVGIYIRGLLLIPHLIIVTFLGMATLLALFVATFAILFTGAFPAGMHGFVAGVLRWSTRLNAYSFGLTDKYPPFSLS